MTDAPRLTLSLLGGLTLTLGDEPVTDLASSKASALLAYLAVTRRPHPRELLADLLWDDRTTEQAAGNLRVLLSSLRKQLKPYLRITRQSVAFNETSPHWLDTDAFCYHIRQAAQDGSEGIAALEEAVALYQGDFLAGFYLRESSGFEEWGDRQRERFRRLVQESLGRLTAHHLAQGSYAEGLPYATRLLALDPLNEEAHRQLMWLLARTGQRNAALRQYEHCHSLLDEELGVEPTEATTRLYQRLRGATAIGSHNLPPRDSPFVGRDRALDALRRQLADPGCRLLTVVGPGGIGKTRLVQQSAAQVAASDPGMFLDGICYVPLASVEEASLLPAAVAEALELRLQAGSAADQQLLAYLHDREILLILDNFEQLLRSDEAAAWVSELLQQAPHLTVVITSRERLNLREEWLFDVQGLGFLAASDTDPRALPDYEAHSLFVERARRVHRSFRPTLDEWREIARLCTLVEGTPLAIELAAAQIRNFSCQEITAQVETGIDFLRSSLRNVPARHRSIRALFDSSWMLLSERQQGVARRLSLFRNPFDEAAAVQVAGANRSILQELMHRSLLGRTASGHYSYHSLVRSYARERLTEFPDELDESQAAHAAYFSALMRDQEAAWRTDQAQQAAMALRPYMDDIRAFWQWASEHGAWQPVAEAWQSLFSLHQLQGSYQEGERTFGRAADALRGRAQRGGLSAQERALLADLLIRQGRFAIYLGDFDAAEPLLQEGLALAETAMTLAYGNAYQGIIALVRGNTPQARTLCEAALVYFDSASSEWGRAFILNLLGNSFLREGAYAEAEQHFMSARDYYERQKSHERLGIVWNNLGNTAEAQERYAVAQERYEQARHFAQASGSLRGLAAALTNLGVVARKLDHLEEAKAITLEALAIKQKLNVRRSIALTHLNLGHICNSLGDYEEAYHHFRGALQTLREVGDNRLLLDGCMGIGTLLTGVGGAPSVVATLVEIVQRHPATSQEIREEASALKRQLAFAPPPAPLPPLDEMVGHILDAPYPHGLVL